MNSKKNLSAAVLLMLVAVAFDGRCSSQDAPPPPPLDAKMFTLEARHKVNEVLKYKMTMNMKMDMKTAKETNALPKLGDMSMNMTMRMKTVGVRPDGTGVIVTQMLDGEMSVMGGKRPVLPTPPITEEVDKRGRVVSMKGPDQIPGAQFLQGMNFKSMGVTGLVLPDHPVKVGDTWETEQPFPVGNSKGKVTCTVLGTENVQGQDTLKIKQLWVVPIVMNMGMDGQPTKDEANAMMNMSGNVNIGSIANVLPSNGRMIRTAADVDMKLIMTMKGPAAAQSPFGETMEFTTSGKTEMSLISAGIATPPAPKISTSGPIKSATKKPAGKGK